MSEKLTLDRARDDLLNDLAWAVLVLLGNEHSFLQDKVRDRSARFLAMKEATAEDWVKE